MSGVPPDEQLRAAFNVLEKHVETKYGVPILIKDVPNPFTGDLDGAEIHVDYAEDIESALFIIAHLFGHTVQWNTDEKAREIGYKLYPNADAAMMKRLHEYELEACRYSMQLFHEAGVRELDQWFSDYSACDFEFLKNFYKTGEKPAFKTFWKTGSPLLEPKIIPSFQPTKWVSRWAGIVV